MIKVDIVEKTITIANDIAMQALITKLEESGLKDWRDYTIQVKSSHKDITLPPSITIGTDGTIPFEAYGTCDKTATNLGKDTSVIIQTPGWYMIDTSVVYCEEGDEIAKFNSIEQLSNK